MYFTAFFPFFAIAFLFAIRGPNQWAIATAVLSFFQAASPILLSVGGRPIGLAPAYCLLPAAFIVLAKAPPERRDDRQNRQIPLDIWLLLYFLVIVAGGAFLLPRVFQNLVNVLPPRGGLDSGFAIPLKASASNVVQIVYTFLNFLLVVTPFIFAKKKIAIDKSIFLGIAIGASISAVLGFYQVIGFQFGLPWPNAIINSNLGVAQLEDQTMIGMRRMSATFLEPSMLSLHFLAAFGVLMLGRRHLPTGLMCLAVLIFSTSTTAYVGLAILLLLWMMTNPDGIDLNMFKFIFPVLLGLIAAAGADYWFTGGEYMQRLFIKKFEHGSGEVRLNADLIAWRSLVDTYGLGVGVGSNRASSLIATLTSSAGLPAALIFFAFIGTVLYNTKRVGTQLAGGFFYGILGVLIAWTLSIPDWNLPLFWMLVGAAIAHRVLIQESPVKPIVATQ